jgi:hypothetical protein
LDTSITNKEYAEGISNSPKDQRLITDQLASLQGRRPVEEGSEIVRFQAAPIVEEQSRTNAQVNGQQSSKGDKLGGHLPSAIQ